MPLTNRSTSFGLTASISASVLFGVIYFFTPLLVPLSAEAVWASRVLIGAPLIAILIVSMGQLEYFREIARRIRAKPVLILGVLASGLLLAVQVWLFAWAPMHGRALQTALGYFLLPLVLVVLGRFLYRDRLRWWHWLAVGIAAVGVGFQIVRVGSVSWETLLVALGYPLYFAVRRALGFAHIGGMLWEFLIVSPLAVFAVVNEFIRNDALFEHPALLWAVPFFGVVSVVALWAYLLASKLLSISIFGLMGYVEPALLVVASYLLGERIARLDFITYGAIWIAVLVLLIGGICSLVGELRRPRIEPS